MDGMSEFDGIGPYVKNHIWALQRVVPTDIGTWTSHEEPWLVFHMNSIESTGSTFSYNGRTEVFQLNFKSGKTIHVEVPEKMRMQFWEEAIWCIGKTK